MKRRNFLVSILIAPFVGLFKYRQMADYGLIYLDKGNGFDWNNPVFATSGTFRVPQNCKSMIVACMGAGGGGGKIT